MGRGFQLVILVIALFGIEGKAEYDKGFEYRCNMTKFDPVKDGGVAQGAGIFTLLVGDGTYGYEPRNRDRIIAYGSEPKFIYTWVHCRSYETCPDCLQAIAEMLKQTCNNCFGVDFLNDDCQISMKIVKLVFAGLTITIGLHTHQIAGHGRYESNITASDQSGGFEWSWNNNNFDESRSPHLKYCTDLFKELLKDGKFLSSPDFLDTVVTCPDNSLPPYVRTMVHCRDRNECGQCLLDAASLMDQNCAHCCGFRASSDDCWVRQGKAITSEEKKQHIQNGRRSKQGKDGDAKIAGHGVHRRYDSNITASDQSRGFEWSWSNKNFDETQSPNLKHCTDLFKELLKNGKFLNSGDFLDTVVTCPDNALPPYLNTMVHCRDRDECGPCLVDAASLMDQCTHCCGFRAMSDDCWVRYETYWFSTY
ncbi:hypothetical protein LINGRAHAP2_LOCUS25958 [Linum grandiflorum]